MTQIGYDNKQVEVSVVNGIMGDGTLQERAQYKTGGLLIMLALGIGIVWGISYVQGTMFTNNSILAIAFGISNCIMGLWLGHSLKKSAKIAYINRKQSTYAFVEQQETNRSMEEEKAVHAQMKIDYPDMFK